MSFGIIRDGIFDSVNTSNLLSRPKDAENIKGVENRAISAGTYDISFQVSP